MLSRYEKAPVVNGTPAPSLMIRVGAAPDIVPAYVSPRQAAAILGITTNTVWQYEHRGLLHRKRLPGRHVRFPIGDVLGLLEDDAAA